VPLPSNSPFPRNGHNVRGHHFHPPLVGGAPLGFGALPYYYFPYMGFTNYFPDMGMGYTEGYSEPPPEASYAPPVAYPPADLYYESAPPAGPQDYNVAPETPAESEQSAATQEPNSVALLAFKDHSIVGVTDYWLQGDTLYYATTYGSKTGIPLTQLDLPLTQKLNQQGNLHFVLEFRP
jgi:hypothetical protein